LGGEVGYGCFFNNDYWGCRSTKCFIEIANKKIVIEIKKSPIAPEKKILPARHQ
jgi:hypothetical protein